MGNRRKKKRRNEMKPKMEKPLFQDKSSPLHLLYKQRHGGSVALNGFQYQIQYSLFRLFHAFIPETKDTISLEGLEDLDYNPELEKLNIQQTGQGKTEHVQVKYTSKSMDANTFWSKEVLQHFAQIYVINPSCHFLFVTNSEFRKGELTSLVDFTTGNLESECITYWRDKLRGFVEKKNEEQEGKEWNDFDIVEFLSSIRFVTLDEKEIVNGINSQLSRVSPSTGNEQLYYNGLCWSVYSWCKDRVTVSRELFHEVIEEITRNIGKGIINPALQNSWIEEVNFVKSDTESFDVSREAYFSGKAARPNHIISGFPVDRDVWRKQVTGKLISHHAVLIRASSGQGKSTLAWQAAWEKKQDGCTIFELRWCKDEEKIGSIVETFKSYLKGGHTPIVIIDGLNIQVRAWSELLIRTSDLPIKYIITTREEDWHRFGNNIPQISIAPVELKMNEIEAKNIYLRLKKENRIHPTVTSWQSCWELVRDRGLLLEFTYLLSFGSMIHERIEEQTRILSQDKDAKSKLEILRLISFADICDVKIESSNLLAYIEKNIGFVGDRGQVLSELHKEYHVVIDEGYLIEGLHPVRSEHLSNILHQSGMPVIDTATNLIQITDNEYLNLLVMNSLHIIKDEKQRCKFISQVGELTLNDPIVKVNRVIEGLFAFDAREHQRSNVEVYDDLFARQLLEMSFIESFPWSGVTILSAFDALGKSEGAEEFRRILAEIKRFDPDSSYTLTFLRERPPLDIKTISTRNMVGFGTYLSWLYRFQ